MKKNWISPFLEKPRGLDLQDEEVQSLLQTPRRSNWKNKASRHKFIKKVFSSLKNPRSSSLKMKQFDGHTNADFLHY